MFSISDYSTQQLSDRSDKQQDYQQQQQQSVSQQKQQKLGLMDDQSVVGSKDHSSPSDFSLKLVSYELNDFCNFVHGFSGDVKGAEFVVPFFSGSQPLALKSSSNDNFFLK